MVNPKRVKKLLYSCTVYVCEGIHAHIELLVSPDLQKFDHGHSGGIQAQGVDFEGDGKKNELKTLSFHAT